MGHKKIAYLILAHMDVEQLNRLIQSLDDNSSDFFIHVDAKVANQFISKVVHKPNVFFAKQRYKIFWTGFNMVLATLGLVRDMLATNKTYQKVVLLSGLDYPIAGNSMIHKYLDNDINYIRGFNISMDTVVGYYQQVAWKHHSDSVLFNTTGFLYKATRRLLDIFEPSRRLRFFARPRTLVLTPDKVVPFYQGSSWWALNQDFLSYVNDFVQTTTGKNVLNQFKYIMAPDEKFFQTLFFNSEFYNKNQTEGPEEFPWAEFHRYVGTVIEGAVPTAYCHNLHIIHPSLQKVYTQADIAMIQDALKDANNLFIRKVTTLESSALLDYIDRSVRHDRE